jgi:hypothetical protein
MDFGFGAGGLVFKVWQVRNFYRSSENNLARWWVNSKSH